MALEFQLCPCPKLHRLGPVRWAPGSHILMLQTLTPLGEEAEVAARGFQNIKVLMQQRFLSLLPLGEICRKWGS